MIPKKTIDELIVKHSTLEKELSSGEVDKKLFAEKSKEYSDINEIIDVAKKHISFEKDKKELEKILNDQTSDDELKKMAETELTDLNLQHEIDEKKLKLLILFQPFSLIRHLMFGHLKFSLIPVYRPQKRCVFLQHL